MKASLSIFSSNRSTLFIAKVVFFFLLLVGVDWLVGAAIEQLYRRAPHGTNWTKENWLLDDQFDVVIFGSSRAFRHYVPHVISEKTGRSVFNAGQNGQYLLYSYALEQLVLERYSPKLIVLDVLPSFIVKVKNPDEEFDETEFTYPGPIPFSKETAVVMMADSVEAASRSIKEPDAERIGELVDSIIDKQLDSGQFSNSDITLKDITRIRKIFKKKL